MVLLLLLAACDPCAGWTAAEVVDETGRLDEGTLSRLEATVAAFYAASGATDACVDRVVIDELEDSRYTWRPHEVTLAPGPAVSDYVVRLALCEVLDHHRGYTESLGEDFLGRCAAGPQRFAWAEQVMAACGASHLDAFDAAVRDAVWVQAPPSPPALDLHAALGEPRMLTDLAPEGSELGSVASTGELLAVRIYADEEAGIEAQVALVDPSTGEVVQSEPLAHPGYLRDGPGLVVVSAYDAGGTWLTSIDPDSGARVVQAEAVLPGNGEAVAGGRLYSAYMASDEVRPLLAADLSTGAVEEIPLPVPAGMVPMAGPRVAVGEQLLVDLSAAEVEVECGGFDCVISSIIYDDSYQLYDPADGSWTEVGRDFSFDVAGAGPGGLVLGTVSVDAGELYAAWDPAGGELYLSDDLCAEHLGRPNLAVGGTAMLASRGADDRSLWLQPLDFSLD